jgi:hypothetical protein
MTMPSPSQDSGLASRKKCAWLPFVLGLTSAIGGSYALLSQLGSPNGIEIYSIPYASPSGDSAFFVKSFGVTLFQDLIPPERFRTISRLWGTGFGILFAVVCGSIGVLVGVGLTGMARGRTRR